ncbi:MAG TPA: malto-oligosyltrehalose trehalohydrolase [Acidimicrobiales bacterium]|nr:malto-oligosyltrehalose trehalohydrolase [Acidimicrobiales bacterium]
MSPTTSRYGSSRSELGAVPTGGDSCSFGVWAPNANRLSLCLGEDASTVVEMRAAADGYFRALVPECPPGTRYRYRLDGGTALADPASRSQPDGVHGSSEVVDVRGHRWGDHGWVAPPRWAYVIYEMHVGTATPGGTFDDAIGLLDGLVELGISAVEPMPVAQFAGRRNWGYDGVFPGAVQNSYGGPAAFQRFVDGCHQRGLAVVLDVVYNHLGPEGNVFGAYGPYFTDAYRTPWGSAINFDGPGSDEVRRYFIDNALGWFADFHVDALRLDAVHSIIDPTARPFLAELAAATADLGVELGRSCLLIAESSANDPRLVTAQDRSGLGLDAQWNDEFHHALHARVTGERFGYYQDFGRLGQLATAITDGFVYQGEFSPFRGRRHGAPTGGIEPSRFVVFAQNHDHIGNRPRGDRLSTLVGFDALRLVAAVLLLSPGIPLIFMGEDYGEVAPFPYFVDHGEPALIEAVRKGRAEEFAGQWAASPLDPADPATFQLAVLDPTLAESGQHAELRRLYAALIRLRGDHPSLARSSAHQITAEARGNELRMHRGTAADAVCALFNFNGEDPLASQLPETPVAGRWEKLVDSGDPDWGGAGDPLPAVADGLTSLTLSPYGFCAYRCRPVGEGYVDEEGN